MIHLRYRLQQLGPKIPAQGAASTVYAQKLIGMEKFVALNRLCRNHACRATKKKLRAPAEKTCLRRGL
jgi:hypothetical protein